MMEIGYLQRLTVQLTAGAAMLPDSVLDPHARFILSQQRRDGGWSGREGESDLYYSGFALRSLAILGLLTGEVANAAGRFLLSRTEKQESVIDLLSLVYGAALIEASTEKNPLDGVAVNWQGRVTDLLTSLRQRDGGFARTAQASLGSTYQTFLVAICLELMGHPLPMDDPSVAFLLSQRRDDGGFLEVRVAKRSGTNPTAAAIGALRTLNALPASIAKDAADFLVELQSDEGGFQANTRMPLPDLLSTFTSCVTLWETDSLERVDTTRAWRYGQSMARSGGGFAGFELDPSEDVEYTFYGLGLLSLLAPWQIV
ncbi:MAG TPA: prenyltransferase/squalene oxidase repeat-containing protein [Pirellula sp.]|nr:prenyltransferase/squalene oxidase repeat-containing protein [Pirellula sp.]